MDPKLGHGTNHCQCGACKEYFTNVRNFDMHRKWRENSSETARTRVCVYPGDLVYGKGKKAGKAKLRLNAKGLWASAEGVYIPRHAG